MNVDNNDWNSCDPQTLNSSPVFRVPPAYFCDQYPSPPDLSFDIDQFLSSSDGKHSGGTSDSGTETSDNDCHNTYKKVKNDPLLISTPPPPLPPPPLTSTSECGTSVVQPSSSNQKCPLCNFVCNVESVFLNHLNSNHSDVMSIACKLCLQSFSLSDMLTHATKCKGSFVCTQCRATFAQKVHLQRHISRTHLAIEQCSCDICGRMLCNKAALKVHKKQHETADFPFKCQFCEMGFNQNFHLQLHTDLYHAHHQLDHLAKPHECPQCSRTFLFAVSLTTHIRTNHSLPRKRNLPCGHCGMMFSHQSERLKHMATHVPPECKPFHCSFCPRTFVRRYELDDHEACHNDPGAYACLECSRPYATLQNLHRHIVLKHFGEGFSCLGDGAKPGSSGDSGGSDMEGITSDKDLAKAVLDQVGKMDHTSCDVDLEFLNGILTDDVTSMDDLGNSN